MVIDEATETLKVRKAEDLKLCSVTDSMYDDCS